MPDRINHAAEAQKVLATPTSSVWGSPGAMLAGAQVHATLAIVEQVRISNLIALLEHLDGDDYIPRLREIEKTLGIEADHE